MTALYNEIDTHAAEWTSNLAQAGHIAPGKVETRSIVDLRLADVAGHDQFHAFAGIGGWSLALRLAGWPDDLPVWTGSCPCQPYSLAGKRKGDDDERNLWPAWFRLIRECRPPVIFGEQVAAAVGHGWLDTVFSDLEAEGYACAAVVLGAHSVGAPHIRQRLWFVAHASGERRDRGELARAAGASPTGGPEEEGRWAAGIREPARREPARLVVNAAEPGRQGLADGRQPLHAQRPAAERAGGDVGGPMGDADAQGFGERAQRDGWPQTGREVQFGPDAMRSDPWSDAEWLPCRDGKARPIEPGTFPLAHGISGRVGRLRAYGNAIVPQVAAAFIGAFLESTPQEKS